MQGYSDYPKQKLCDENIYCTKEIFLVWIVRVQMLSHVNGNLKHLKRYMAILVSIWCQNIYVYVSL